MRVFEEVVELLKEYKKEYGDLLVPQAYTTEAGIRLGSIVVSIRTGGRKTSEEEKAILDDLGFVWSVRNVLPFEEVVELLKEHKKEYGDLLVPQAYTTEAGIRLGSIVVSIRTGGRKTSEEEKAILDDLGFVWSVRNVLPFEEVVELLKEYKKEYGDLLVPHAYITPTGICLGFTVHSIRTDGRKTSEEEKAILNDLGFVWSVRNSPLPFEEVVELLKEYKKEYGDLLVPQAYTTQVGIRLGSIVLNIRTGGRKTSEEEKAILNDLGFVWKAPRGRRGYEFNDKKYTL